MATTLQIEQSRLAAKGIGAGSRWRNKFTDEVVTVTKVAPCDVLGGQWRVWDDGRVERACPSNGHDPDAFRHAWARVR